MYHYYKSPTNNAIRTYKPLHICLANESAFLQGFSITFDVSSIYKYIFNVNFSDKMIEIFEIYPFLILDNYFHYKNLFINFYNENLFKIFYHYKFNIIYNELYFWINKIILNYKILFKDFIFMNFEVFIKPILIYFYEEKWIELHF